MNIATILSKFNVPEDAKKAICTKYEELRETISNEDTGKSTCDDIRHIINNMEHKDKKEIHVQVDEDLQALQRHVVIMTRATENLKMTATKLSSEDIAALLAILTNLSAKCYCDELSSIIGIIRHSGIPHLDKILLELTVTEILLQIMAVKDRYNKRKSEALQAEINRKSEEIKKLKKKITK